MHHRRYGETYTSSVTGGAAVQRFFYDCPVIITAVLYGNMSFHDPYSSPLQWFEKNAERERQASTAESRVGEDGNPPLCIITEQRW